MSMLSNKISNINGLIITLVCIVICYGIRAFGDLNRRHNKYKSIMVDYKIAHYTSDGVFELNDTICKKVTK